MEKNDVFKFTAPNGVEAYGVAIAKVSWRPSPEWDYESPYGITTWLCYSQRRLFTFIEDFCCLSDGERRNYYFGETLVDYCIIPELDSLLDYDSEECSEDDEDSPIEYPHYDDELEALESMKKHFND